MEQRSATADATTGDKLPDLLRPGQAVVFVGTAAGMDSAVSGEYFAGPGNRFWRTLHAIGMTPIELAPRDFCRLPDFGIGLTDLAKHVAGQDDTLRGHHFDLPRFETAITLFRPRAVAFNGKKAASVALNRRSKRLSYGRQQDCLPGTAATFILPSTSGAASRYWDERHWHELADFIARA